MIAARPKKLDSLQLVELVLQLRRNQNAAVPDKLKGEFMNIVGQTCDLITDPVSASEHPRDWSPEAIALAVVLRRKENEEIAHRVCEWQSFNSVTPPDANNVLASIGSSLAA